MIIIKNDYPFSHKNDNPYSTDGTILVLGMGAKSTSPFGVSTIKHNGWAVCGHDDHANAWKQAMAIHTQPAMWLHALVEKLFVMWRYLPFWPQVFVVDTTSIWLLHFRLFITDHDNLNYLSHTISSSGSLNLVDCTPHQYTLDRSRRPGRADGAGLPR